MPPKNPQPKRVEGRSSHSLPSIAEEFNETTLHLSSCFIGKSNSEYRARFYPIVVDEVSHSMGKYPSFARTCAGKNKNRAFKVQRSFQLLIV